MRIAPNIINFKPDTWLHACLANIIADCTKTFWEKTIRWYIVTHAAAPVYTFLNKPTTVNNKIFKTLSFNSFKDSLNIFMGWQSPCGTIFIKQNRKMLLALWCLIYILLRILSQSLACIIYCASCALITTANGKNCLWCGERFARFNSLHPLAKLTVC